MLRAAIYARVSSAAQRDAHTIDSQLAVLRPFVRSQGYELVGEYIDDGRSAKTGMLDRRDGFARLVRDAELQRFDVLVVFDVDRLTRTDDIAERAAILSPFQRAGIRIVSPSGGEIDLRTMFGQLDATLRSLYAAEENRKRAERIKAGKARAIAEGRKPAGPTPYGLAYTRATGAWSVNPATGPIVIEIYERVIAGESCAAIAEDLHLRAIPRPRGEWNGPRVWAIARSRHAVGEWTVDKRRGLAIAVPAIVTETMYQRAQQSLLKHGKRGLRRTKHVYLLEGLAICGACGAPMLIRSATKNRRGYVNPPAYVCRARKLPLRDTPRCSSPVERCSEIDARVWAELSRVIQDPDLIDAALERRRAAADDPDVWKKDADGYRRRIAQLDRAETALLARFSRGTVSETALDVELARLGRERVALREQLAGAEKAAAAAGAASSRVDDAKSALRRLAPILPNASQSARRELVAMLVRPGEATFAADGIQLGVLLPEAGSAAARSRGARGGAVSLASASGWSSEYENDRPEGLRIRLVA